MEVDIEKLQKSFDVVLAYVKEAGNIIKTHAEKDHESCEEDLVRTDERDLDVENFLVTSLRKHFPCHKIIATESFADGQKCQLSDNCTWIIDPVGGTINFIHNYPNFCISVSLWVHKKPHIGIIYNPVLEQMFTARKGKGAFLNGSLITSSSVTEVEEALILYEYGATRDPEHVQVTLENIGALITRVQAIRSCGSAALNMAMVAMGGADCYLEFGVHIWDIAAGTLLIQEAGGFVCDPDGGELDPHSRRVFCAGTQDLARKIIPLIKQLYPKRD